MAARRPAAETGPASPAEHGKTQSAHEADLLVMELVGEALGNDKVAQWYKEALEIKKLYEGLPYGRQQQDLPRSASQSEEEEEEEESDE